MKLSEYVDRLIAHGKCYFSLDEAVSQMGKTRQSILLSIEHLKARGELASPAKGFYVIVTPEYRIYECLPPEYFIPYLMSYWGHDYYCGLLTAAMYHGSSHQAPQVFQVIIEKGRTEIECGKVRIQFIARKDIKDVPRQKISTSKSVLQISSPEATAMDLVYYPQRCGGLNHIATVLSELHEKMQPEKLSLLLETFAELAWKQRLGYLLDKLAADKLANVVNDFLARQRRVDYISLMPGLIASAKVARNEKWKIIENTTIEADE
jgi:predicted transcriptional regulator of viral defense system